MTNAPYNSAYPSVRDAVEQFRRTHPNGKVGLTTGCFDLLHPGHLAMLQACKKECDFLVVCVTSDEMIRHGKAAGSSVKPVMSEDDRLRLVRGLGCVDKALIRYKEDKSLKELSLLINPNIRFFGPDQEPRNGAGYVAETCDTKRIEGARLNSTSSIIQKIIDSKTSDESYRSSMKWAEDRDWFSR